MSGWIPWIQSRVTIGYNLGLQWGRRTPKLSILKLIVAMQMKLVCSCT